MASLSTYLGFWIRICTLLLQLGQLSAIGLVVNTTKGKIQGFEDQVGRTTLYIYLGIPFAKPPLDDFRVKRPEEMTPWDGVKAATALPPACIQRIDESFNRFLGIEMMNPNTGISEDCLYLNVWAPNKAVRMPRAVMVWIYGGGLYSGSSTLDKYDGKKLASSHDVIVVSMNYRVGPLGFLYNGQEEAPGNQGLLDQQMALRWVKDNIANFGGDPDRITLFGESAGAASVSYHLLASGSHGLFNNAILQSGTFNVFAYRDTTKAREMSKEFAQSVGCEDEESDEINCLRQMDAESLFDSKKYWLRPTVDGVFITDEPRSILKGGRFKKTSVLAGFNRNEGSLFCVFKMPEILGPFKKDVSLTKEQFQQLLVDAVITRTGRNDTLINDAVLFHYETNIFPPNATYLQIVDQITSDSYINCGMVELANYYSNSATDVYMYFLEHRTKNYPWPEWMGTTHGVDIDYVFGNPPYTFTPGEKRLSQDIMTYWANFAKTGNPNGASLPEWPRYTAEEGSYLQLGIGDKMTSGRKLRAPECALWNDFLPKLESELDECSAVGTSSAATSMLTGITFSLYIIVSLICSR